MRPRIEQEFTLLLRYYPGIQHAESSGDDWFLLPDYPFPPGWRIGDEAIEKAPVTFKVPLAYPTAPPYGFAAPAGVNFKGAPPGNPGGAVTPPFPGSWQHFSWAPDGEWAPSNDAQKGPNLLVWARSFSARLKEGA